MRLGDLFRIRYILGTIAVFLTLQNPAHALWLEVTGVSYAEPAQLLVNLEGKSPPRGDEQHGLFALPPNYRDPNPYSTPRLAVQYRADFPISVTFATDGAIGGERMAPTGALNLTTRIIFMETWWSPSVTANVYEFSLESVAAGRLEFGAVRPPVGVAAQVLDGAADAHVRAVVGVRAGAASRVARA